MLLLCRCAISSHLHPSLTFAHLPWRLHATSLQGRLRSYRPPATTASLTCASRCHHSRLRAPYHPRRRHSCRRRSRRPPRFHPRHVPVRAPPQSSPSKRSRPHRTTPPPPMSTPHLLLLTPYLVRSALACLASHRRTAASRRLPAVDVRRHRGWMGRHLPHDLGLHIHRHSQPGPLLRRLRNLQPLPPYTLR